MDRYTEMRIPLDTPAAEVTLEKFYGFMYNNKLVEASKVQTGLYGWAKDKGLDIHFKTFCDLLIGGYITYTKLMKKGDYITAEKVAKLPHGILFKSYADAQNSVRSVDEIADTTVNKMNENGFYFSRETLVKTLKTFSPNT